MWRKKSFAPFQIQLYFDTLCTLYVHCLHRRLMESTVSDRPREIKRSTLDIELRCVWLFKSSLRDRFLKQLNKHFQYCLSPVFLSYIKSLRTPQNEFHVHFSTFENYKTHRDLSINGLANFGSKLFLNKSHNYAFSKGVITQIKVL